MAEGSSEEFAITMRGYDRTQVDQRIKALSRQLGDAKREVASLDQRAMTLAGELADAQRRLREADKPTYAGLGSRIEQLLRSAEEQSTSVLSKANAEADALLARTRANAAHLSERSSSEAATMVADARREAAELRSHSEAESSTILANAQARADELVASAQRKADQITSEARANATEARSAADRDAQLTVAAAKKSAAEMTVTAEREASETREAAESAADALRRSSQDQADSVKETAAEEARITVEKARAEAESLLSSIKVLAILAFIVLGALAIIGVIPYAGYDSAPLLSNLTADGLFPQGLGAVFTTMLTVNFAFSGTELIGITAGETKDPGTTVPRAIHATLWRLVIFFIGSITVMSALIPWHAAGVEQSPFVTVFNAMGIPFAGTIMNVVILAAILSAANSGLYASTRMLWSLADEGTVPRVLARTNRFGVPAPAMAASMTAVSLRWVSSNV